MVLVLWNVLRDRDANAIRVQSRGRKELGGLVCIRFSFSLFCGIPMRSFRFAKRGSRFSGGITASIVEIPGVFLSLFSERAKYMGFHRGAKNKARIYVNLTLPNFCVLFGNPQGSRIAFSQNISGGVHRRASRHRGWKFSEDKV